MEGFGAGHLVDQPDAVTIAAMEEKNAQATPQLLTDIQFKVSRKGYDPGEVDAFLERLSAAVTQMQDRLRQASATAQDAERRASEAVREAQILQTRVDELESGVVFASAGEDVSPEFEAEQASSVLAMAKRTADAVMNDARTNAAALLSEAETEASNILRDAKEKAIAAVGDLDATRQELSADAAALAAFMDEQRASLSAGLSRIQHVLDDPSALRVGVPPTIQELAALEGDATVAPSSDFPISSTTVIDDATVVDEEPPATAPVRIVGLEEIDPPVPGVSAGAEASDADAEPNEGGQLFGAKDDEVDEAMRKFFDANFDDDDRFGR